MNADGIDAEIRQEVFVDGEWVDFLEVKLEAEKLFPDSPELTGSNDRYNSFFSEIIDRLPTRWVVQRTLPHNSNKTTN